MELEIVMKLAAAKQVSSAPKHQVNHQAVKQFLATNNLRLLVSDKDKRFVLCKEDDFIFRANEFLSQSQIINDDSTPTVLRRTKKIIALPGVALTLTGCLDPPTNIACPRLFFQLKTYKANWPLRPLVNKRSHPTYFLKKVLAKFLRELILESPYVTSSSIAAKSTIASSMRCTHEDSYTFYKLDMVSLYPSVPVFEAVMLANFLIIKKGFNIQQVLDIRDALTFITEHNYFLFNKSIYLQKRGVPMGSPLSAVLAELIMREVERRIFNSPLTISYPSLYLRYVDDILLVWENTEEEFIKFVQQLSSIYPTIGFTWEREHEDSIAFLDLCIQKSVEGLQFAVYHKADLLPYIILADTFQLLRYVNAAIAALVRRALLLPSTQLATKIELDIIRVAVSLAGFTYAKYKHVLRKVKEALYPCTTLYRKEKASVIRSSLPYLGPTSIRISRIFQRYNFILPITPIPNLRRCICNDRDRLTTLEKSGVYTIQLENPVTGNITRYIGATTRMLASRLAEHQDDVAKGRCSTELPKKVLEQGYNPLWPRTEIIKCCNNRRLVFIWEALLTATSEACNVPTLDLPGEYTKQEKYEHNLAFTCNV
ncbi:uncharacterized protein LOC111625808 [Centruroides sculpturatus]|uniref:uncharacterized protein LOC111625808 n=1 Tax=Centruroides sculpturatus TaxID=218467 RepID=UPI000C6ECBEE|nr:uncharacterized protein LOC111625808 [Centruroides sculpturatus]